MQVDFSRCEKYYDFSFITCHDPASKVSEFLTDALVLLGEEKASFIMSSALSHFSFMETHHDKLLKLIEELDIDLRPPARIDDNYKIYIAIWPSKWMENWKLARRPHNVGLEVLCIREGAIHLDRLVSKMLHSAGDLIGYFERREFLQKKVPDGDYNLPE